MNGQMTRYKESLIATPYKDYSKLLKVNIDYKGLIAYAKTKKISPAELSDDEQNMFIKNSNMKEIRSIREELGI